MFKNFVKSILLFLIGSVAFLSSAQNPKNGKLFSVTACPAENTAEKPEQAEGNKPAKSEKKPKKKKKKTQENNNNIETI